MEPDLSALVYIVIALIVVFTFFGGNCAGGACP